MQKKRKIGARASLFLPVCCALLLLGCGGGSDTPSSNPQSTESPTVTAQGVSGSSTVPRSWKGRVPILTVNTNWAPRTQIVSGKVVSYIFGNGNPPEVSLQPDQYVEKQVGKYWNPGVPYVTPAVEVGVKDFLSSSQLQAIYAACKKNGQAKISTAMESLSLDINDYLLIDPKTGRKSLSNERINKAADVLDALFDEVQDLPYENSVLNKCFPGQKSLAMENLDALGGFFTKIWLYYNK